jgi:hypothetical protein
LAGAGALRSTARDLAVFVAANARLADSSLSHVMLECQQPRESTGPFGKIGLMWQIDTLHKTIWHNGGTGGYRSYIGFKADGSRGVVVLANSANSVDDLGQYLLGDKAKVDDFKLTKARRAIQLPREVLEAYVGQYKFSLAPVTITATRDGNRFYIQMTGQERLEFFPESQTDFFTKVVDAQLTFVTNGASQATAVVLHQNGIDQTAKRIGPP